MELNAEELLKLKQKKERRTEEWVRLAWEFEKKAAVEGRCAVVKKTNHNLIKATPVKTRQGIINASMVKTNQPGLKSGQVRVMSVPFIRYKDCTCGRPNSPYVCDVCNIYLASARIRKRCKIHPGVYKKGDITCCPECGSPATEA